MSTRSNTFLLTIPIFFDAAHQLSDSKDLLTKKCAQLHGHTYHAIISIHAPDNARHGMVVDFKKIKDCVNDKLDHRFVNDVFTHEYKKIPPEATAENIALYIKEITQKLLRGDAISAKVSVQLAEGYKGTENTSYVVV